MSKPLGPYSPVMRAGDFVFVSGQGGMLDGTVVDGGVAAETAQAMKNLTELVESVGATLADVVKTTCFLADMDDFAEFNEVYASVWPGDHRPARSTIEAARLPAGFLVEVEAIVYSPQR